MIPRLITAALTTATVALILAPLALRSAFQATPAPEDGGWTPGARTGAPAADWTEQVCPSVVGPVRHVRPPFCGAVIDMAVGAPPAPPSPGASIVHDAFGVTAEGTMRATVGGPTSPTRRATASTTPHAARRTAATPSKAPLRRVVRQPAVQSKYGVPWLTRSGTATTYGAGWSEWWVALPHGPGWRFRVCGAGGCRELVSHDAGPDLAAQRMGRIVDLPIGAFEDVCGVPWRMGVCQVTVTILGKA